MLKNNELYSITITGYTSDGEGVGRVDGEVVFVPRTILGETCRVRIVNVGRTAAHGVVEEIITPSAHRVVPECPYFAKCGGCDFWHMDYEAELSLKQQRVHEALTRIGGFTLPLPEICGADSQTGYRNKVQYPVAQQRGRAVAGFFRARTHEVIPIDTCRIQPDCADRLRAAVLDWMRAYRVPAYDERTHSGIVRHIYLRKGFASGEILCCVVVNCKTLRHAAELVTAIRAALPETTSIVLSYNEKRGNSVLGDRFETIFGTGYIEDTLCGLRFRLSARSFYQVNHDQAERLYRAAVAFADLHGTESVLDLYCGTGTITLCLAREAGQAYGVEIIPEAIRDAEENAVQNNIQNVQFSCADASAAAQAFAARGEQPDVIVVDPPRKGLSRDVVDAMLQMSPARIVYVSCDPATLARDARLLCDGGYALQRVQAFDLFPRCAHVETVVLLSKGEVDSKKVRVEFSLEDMDMSDFQDSATYTQIKDYVLEHSG